MPTEPVISLYEPALLAEVAAIWNQVVEEGEAYLFDTPFTLPEMARMLAEQTAVYCETQDGRVRGFYILHPNFPGRGAHIANASYAVARQARGQGTGRRLAEHSLRAARRHGFSAMQFNAVAAANTAANRLWLSLGFQKAGEIPAAFRLDSGEKTALNLYYKAL